jgi:hypothetical protein
VKIGDYLYDLWVDWDGNETPDRVRLWPVRKITERFVYVEYPSYGDEKPLCRFDRATLEAEGHAYSRSAREILYVRPGIDWPLTVISVSAPQPKAVGAAERMA